MRQFTIISLLPAGLIVLGLWLGGLWVLAAVIYLTGFMRFMDRAVKTKRVAITEPSGTTLSVCLAIMHFALLGGTVITLARAAHGTAENIGLFFATGLFLGQISNANAHELIHRGQRGLHRLGMWVYISMLFGHHTSAHVLIHHRHVATRADPNTSRMGEGFYRFALRAWGGSFMAGFRAEAARPRAKWRNPYVIYVLGALGLMLLALMISPRALLVYVGLAAYAQMQLLMSDYVQHYGLMRAIGADGKPAPVGPQHSWNSPRWFSSALMLNATHHSDHHAHPLRYFPALDVPSGAPMLPKPLPVMGAIALIPPLWRHIMDPLVKEITNA
ncbi:alkane 1-monooxygenase [Yoonia tamlensis]|uniref:Alkane 1-monooxygenase n=2 Tax=Yoonia tamlensis TaxID=390270 RepID=A0A1I6G1F7_9RHOB|nr:alkane 1-monooxygenase [Yoonia tamlensis]